MKTFRFIAFLFYRYYSTGPTKDIPYASTLCALVMLIGLHIFQLLVLLNKVDLLPIRESNTRVENFLVMALCVAPLFLLVTFLIRKSDLKEMNHDEGKIRTGNKFLILYIIASIMLLLILILLRKGNL